ncbi:serine hydrolase domain-containing protein [Robertkochia aurantiaca]|uniref:serine hydrolase domain-containing protein n=1 Tax=Robertkochia aurantiaca TaxID=2873700 RepID=UPI001CCC40F2|nr:serine hydrolase domain-containing protein [Robertkochia sp. 3YJGBD-33]
MKHFFVLSFLLGFQYVFAQAGLFTYRADDRANSVSGLRVPYEVERKVDSLVNDAVQQEAFPGAQLLVAKEGEVIFHKTYGFHTYDSLQPVSHTDLYDLASVTKISGPLPALMKLVGEGEIDLDVPFSKYWKPWKRRSDKRDITLREILAHQAGLQPYIVFVKELYKKNGKFKRRFIRNESSKRFPVKISDTLFLHRRFKKKVYRIINRSEVSGEKEYRYSGLSFLIFPEIIEEVTGVPYESYVKNEIYRPIGADDLIFNPEGHYPNDKIVPTEIDTIFRKKLVRGSVHDENASLMGGVSGNAGLFGTAGDLAKLMQLYLQQGVFDGAPLIDPFAVNEFREVQFPDNDNRRGLGFDKPLLDNKDRSLEDAYPAPDSSMQSFGHAGFTGTFVWADPEGDWVFVFLSNRVYPDRGHRSLYTLKIREKLMQVFYDGFPDADSRIIPARK